MNAKPLVSILINNYNYDQFIKEAIDSAINQTYPHTEVVVVDDGSTDQSRDIIQSYGDQIVTIFQKNQGQASAFNAGFLGSRGEIICLLDSDDIFLPTKVEEVVEAFKSYAESGWLFHPQKLLDSSGNEISPQNLDPSNSQEYDVRIPMRRGKLNHYLPEFGLPATSAFCFRRSLLEKILPMPTTEKIYLSDNYIKYLALAFSKGFVIEKPLSIQRIHARNAFTQKSDQYKKIATARISILTAYWMRIKSPELSKFTHNLLAGGLQEYWKLRKSEPEYQTIVKQYLSNISIQEKFFMYSKALYYYLTW